MASPQAPAVARAIAVLELLAAERDGLGVNAIARQLGLVPSSCLHILRALAEGGMVQADPRTKHYSLGLGLLTLAHDMLGRDPFAAIVQPELERIARRHEVTATAVQLDGRERMVVVAVAQAPALLRIQVGVGSRFPAWISATGRCVAARSGLSASQLRQRFAALKWQSPPTFERWLREIETARRDGWAIDAGDYIAGFTIVAAPVEEPAPGSAHAPAPAGGAGAPLRAVSVVGVSERLDAKTLRALTRDTRDAASRVAARLRGGR